MLRASAFVLTVAVLGVLVSACGGPARAPERVGDRRARTARPPSSAARVPALDLPAAVDASGDRVLVGAVRAERGADGWIVGEEALDGWIIAAAPDGDGWLFVSWLGEVARSATFTGALQEVGTIPAFVERQPSAGPLVVLGADLRLYRANGAGAMSPLAGLGERGVVAAAFDGPTHGLALDLGGELLETSDAGRRWTTLALGPGETAQRTLARAAAQSPATVATLSAADVAAILGAVLARVGPVRAYGDGLIEVLAGGTTAIRIAPDRFILLAPDGRPHEVSPPCPETQREGATLVSRCEDRAHVLDPDGPRWLAVAPGHDPWISPTGRTVVTGSGCGPDDPVQVTDVRTGATRVLATSCLQLDAVTDAVGWGRQGEPPTAVRLDLATGRQERVTTPTPADRWESLFNGDGSLLAVPTSLGGDEAARVTLVSPDGGYASAVLPRGASGVDLDGVLGLAAGEAEDEGGARRQLLWETRDRGRAWSPVALPHGALLQYPSCLAGLCIAGNVRVTRDVAPAMSIREAHVATAMPPMPALRCTTTPVAEAPPDTQVVETAHATVELAVGRDEQVTVRWRLLGGRGSATPATAEGRIRGLVGDEQGAYRFFVSVVTSDLVVFSARLAGREAAVPWMARRGRGLSPAPRALAAPTGWGTELPDGGFVDVVGAELRVFDREGRAGATVALHGPQASGWALVDGAVGPAFVVGLAPDLPVYVQLPTGTRRLAVRSTPLVGCAPGATGALVGLRDFETEVDGANGALQTELVVGPDGSACIARLSNPATTEGVARLVAQGPDLFEGVVLHDGAAYAAVCGPRRDR